jgi:hypothetical protein
VKPRSVLGNALLYGAVLTLVVAVFGAAIGFFVAGVNGVISALVGAALAATFMGLTAVSVLVASRVTRNDSSSVAYFGIILGVWFLKLVLFLFVILALRSQPWLSPYVFFVAVIAAVLGSLIADVVAIQRTRVSYVGDIDLSNRATPPTDP